MAVKTKFSEFDIMDILSEYDIGDYISHIPIKEGTVQTNYIIETTDGKFVLRYYDSRTFASVKFENNVLNYLKKKKFPCAGQISDVHGIDVNEFKGKPYILFEFVDGIHIDRPSPAQKSELIKKVADLHRLTQGYRPSHIEDRWNYSSKLALELARIEAKKIGTDISKDKLKWFKKQISFLKLPFNLPKGICHADFHFSNVLYSRGKFKALIDFDDANYTYLLFDLVGLIEAEAWPHDGLLDLFKAKKIIQKYSHHRRLNDNEKRHLFDVYKMSVLFDCIWYFKRGNAKNFYERKKIKHLDEIGRDRFYDLIFR